METVVVVAALAFVVSWIFNQATRDSWKDQYRDRVQSRPVQESYRAKFEREKSGIESGQRCHICGKSPNARLEGEDYVLRVEGTDLCSLCNRFACNNHMLNGKCKNCYKKTNT